MTKNEVLEALTAAKNAPYVAGSISGCGRAYVCITSSNDRSVVNAVATACRQLGLLFERKGHYGTGKNSIYIGYDNADGRALARSKVFAKVLSDRGIPAYDDAVSD